MKDRQEKIGSGYNTLDPMGQIYAQGDMYRKASSVTKGRKRYISYMAIIFAFIVFFLPCIAFLVATVISFQTQKFDPAIIYIFLILFLGCAIGYKIIKNSIRNIRNIRR